MLVSSSGWKSMRLLLATLVLSFIGCHRAPERVHFVLPDGFRGVFGIWADDPEGTELRTTDGRYVIHIPESGVLKMTGHDPFSSFLETASFANGDVIWVSTKLGDSPPPGAIGLWGTVTASAPGAAGSRAINVFYWFVGTEAEFRMRKSSTGAE